MTDIQIIDNKIKINNGDTEYVFNCDRLSSYSADVRDYEIEYVFADVTNNYLTVIVTVASGQAGIIAVVDVDTDKVVHIQNGSYAVAALVSDENVISFHDVASYGHSPFYAIDITKFGNMNMEAESKTMKVSYEPDFYNGKDTISMALDGTTLKLSNGSITHTEDISDLI